MSPKEKLDALESLKRSAGWQLVVSTMQEEIQRATQQLTNPMLRPVDDKDFRRGAIWAAFQLTDLPDRLKQQIMNDLFVEQSKAALDDPASKAAGLKESLNATHNA